MAGGAGAQYVTSIDRVGLALGAGGALAGLAAMLLLALGGQQGVAALVTGWLIGGFFAMAGIVAVAGPIWLALHLANHRGPLTAALTGALVALVVFTAGQTWGFGLFDPVSAERGSAGARIASALLTSAGIAAAAAGIGWTMQRIAYRRLF